MVIAASRDDGMPWPAVVVLSVIDDVELFGHWLTDVLWSEPPSCRRDGP